MVIYERELLMEEARKLQVKIEKKHDQGMIDGRIEGIIFFEKEY